MSENTIELNGMNPEKFIKLGLEVVTAFVNNNTPMVAARLRDGSDEITHIILVTDSPRLIELINEAEAKWEAERESA